MWKLYRDLKNNGVLSINKRNADYVLPYNSRKLYPLVDDKLKTKNIALAANIDVPQLYHVIESEHEIANLEEILAGRDDFVIKPAHGAGGDGIIVICGKHKDRYRKVSGALMTMGEMAYHLSMTLSGAYSLGGYPTQAMVEQRVIVDKTFATVSHGGVPDIRVITLLGYPAMAMVRLPTRQSDGRANLHQGAIAAGINLSTGKTVGGVYKNESIDEHPDTLVEISNIQVPHWEKILTIAASAYEITGLGYLGVDLVLDETHGPLMLELNARPGLNIQIANHAGLVDRYRCIQQYEASHQNVDVPKRVAFSRKTFC